MPVLSSLEGIAAPFGAAFTLWCCFPSKYETGRRIAAISGWVIVSAAELFLLFTNLRPS
jgi:hypothetical protein